jgi:upstream activation factor subunit UAF30
MLHTKQVGLQFECAKTGMTQMPAKKKKKTNAAFLKMAQAPLKPSPQLADVLGSAALISRPQVAKKVWAYIKKHKLQDPKKRREIVADEKLKPIFGKARLDMFQMTKAISKHLSK